MIIPFEYSSELKFADGREVKDIIQIVVNELSPLKPLVLTVKENTILFSGSVFKMKGEVLQFIDNGKIVITRDEDIIQLKYKISFTTVMIFLLLFSVGIVFGFSESIWVRLGISVFLVGGNYVFKIFQFRSWLKSVTKKLKLVSLTI